MNEPIHQAGAPPQAHLAGSYKPRPNAPREPLHVILARIAGKTAWPWAMRVDDMAKRAAIATGETVESIMGDGRRATLSRSRWCIMLALDGCGWSTPRIGRALGDRDHTTVMHGLKRARSLRQSDPDFALLYRLITE